ncbi:hypothetical protein FOZ61_007420 [Perkinsus olseni]|uniref:Phosphatidylinositol N-acetylglucosaminyltransferase subunit H conserved domain-containing protein n=1 Tax=Perkinsus olseni TaxID=32597 RepID=A0A7J6L926_PEROL|nr:hypothetical protein FOZ61_007420 [Perkinsus olseni]
MNDEDFEAVSKLEVEHITKDTTLYRATPIQCETEGLKGGYLVTLAVVIIAVVSATTLGIEKISFSNIVALWWPSWSAAAIMFSLLLVLWWMLFSRNSTVVEESVLLVKGLGIQLQTLYAGGGQRTEFIQISAVRDVVLQEAVYGFRIVTYLAIEVESDEDEGKSLRTAKNSRLILPFETLEIPTRELVEVYFALRDLVPQIADDSSTEVTDSESEERSSEGD